MGELHFISYLTVTCVSLYNLNGMAFEKKYNTTEMYQISGHVCYIFSLSIVVVVVVIEEFDNLSSVEFSSPFMAESES